MVGHWIIIIKLSNFLNKVMHVEVEGKTVGC
jgi:hypothetical protein